MAEQSARSGSPSIPPGYRADAFEALYEGLRDAGVDFAAFLPDSILDPLAQMVVDRGEIDVYQCAREDEGIAMAIGAYMTGRRPVVMMEGSGVGLSGLILARSVAQHTGALLLVAHSSVLGEPFDFHAATRMVAEPVLQALGIPCVTLDPASDIKTVINQACITMVGQQVPVGVLVPPYIVREG